jgi:uncharacterized protein YjbJ (UPF0337 family)
MTDTNHRMDAESPSAEGVTQTARDEAGQLRETSVEAGRQVAGTVKEKASYVTSDAREQARQLAGQTREELVGQARQQKDRATDGLRSVSHELRGMAEHGESGLGTQLARHGADFTDQAADFLQKHEPGELLDEVRGYARRKPGTFLLVAVAAGVVAGRLTRSLAAGSRETPSNSTIGVPEQSAGSPAADDYLVPPPSAPMSAPPVPPPSAPMSAPPVTPTSAPPPAPTPLAPDPDPGAPVSPRFGPGQ